MTKTLQYFVHSDDKNNYDFVNHRGKKILHIFSISEYVYDTQYLQELINIADVVKILLYSGFSIPPNKHTQMHIYVSTKYILPNNSEYIAHYNDADKSEYILNFLEHHPNSKVYVKFKNSINYLNIAKNIIFEINNNNYSHFLDFANYINNDIKIGLIFNFLVNFIAQDLAIFGNQIYSIKLTLTDKNITELAKYVKLAKHKLIIKIVAHNYCKNYNKFIDALYEKPNINIIGQLNDEINDANNKNKILAGQIRYKKIKSAAKY